MPKGIYKRTTNKGWFEKGHVPKYKDGKMPSWVGEKVSLAKKAKNFKHLDSSKLKMSQGHKGKTSWNKDKKLSTKHRENLSKNSSRFWLGKKRPEVERRKLEGSYKGNKQPGYKHREDSKRKMSIAAHKRPPQKFPFSDTSIELKLQAWLKEQKIEFETQYPILGRPDIFIKPNICIFADGCYFHKCPSCGYNDLIKNEKDQRITNELQKQGYTVIRLWEHDINKNKVEQLTNLIAN